MGSRRRKEIVFQEESEQRERRRSRRIIALEEKRERAKELGRKNDSTNIENRNKGKIKETTNEGDDFIFYYDDAQHSPTKKGRKYKALHQLISSTQPMQEGQLPKSRSTSTTNVSSLNSMPLKHVLEYVLDVLQRKDPGKLFAELLDPNEGDYYKIVKQPMDFGTMRAKLHEDMYTSIKQFKLDVYLLCANAMNANPPNTRRHRVARAIHSLARRLFEDLSVADPQHFQLEPLVAPSRKLQSGQSRTMGHARFRRKPAGKNIYTRSPTLEIEKRDKCWPPNDKSLCAEVLNAHKPNFQLNKNAGNYNDSLVRYVEELGPAAQNVAAKRLEDLKFRQFLDGETWSPSLATVVDTQITQLEALKFQQLSSNGETPTLNLHNVCGSQHTLHAGVNIRENGSKGKGVGTEENMDAYAAALLSNIYSNHDKKETNKGLVKDQNVSSSLQGANQNRVLQLGGRREYNNNNPTMILNKHVDSCSTSKDGASSSHVQVWPTRAVSESQPKPQEHSISRFFDPRAPLYSGNSVLPSQPANFSIWDKSLQDLMSPTKNHFSNSSCPTQNQLLKQCTPPMPFGYHDLQVQLGQMNPMGPFPLQQPKSSSSLKLVQQEERKEGTPLLLPDNDQELNLALQL